MEQELTKVCAWCKKVKRGDSWVKEEIEDESNVTHVMCEECFERLNGETA